MRRRQARTGRQPFAVVLPEPGVSRITARMRYQGPEQRSRRLPSREAESNTITGIPRRVTRTLHPEPNPLAMCRGARERGPCRDRHAALPRSTQHASKTRSKPSGASPRSQCPTASAQLETDSSTEPPGAECAPHARLSAAHLGENEHPGRTRLSLANRRGPRRRADRLRSWVSIQLCTSGPADAKRSIG